MALSIAAIQDLVARRTGVPVALMVSDRRDARTVSGRHEAIWLCRQAGHTLPLIGRCFGDRDHSTIAYSVSRIWILVKRDPAYGRLLTTLATDALESGGPRRVETPGQAALFP
jgi:chromosomal replication initiator protein